MTPNVVHEEPLFSRQKTKPEIHLNFHEESYAKQRKEEKMPKHTVRVPAALWDEWQPKLSPEEWPLPILGMLATAGSQSLEEITNALQVTRFEVQGHSTRW